MGCVYSCFLEGICQGNPRLPPEREKPITYHWHHWHPGHIYPRIASMEGVVEIQSFRTSSEDVLGVHMVKRERERETETQSTWELISPWLQMAGDLEDLEEHMPGQTVSEEATGVHMVNMMLTPHGVFLSAKTQQSTATPNQA
uniref:Uncharacterized protein n=1 Tax=Pan troglodytes TaxID=9598 RepID=A0A2I3TVV1_PANTR